MENVLTKLNRRRCIVLGCSLEPSKKCMCIDEEKPKDYCYGMCDGCVCNNCLKKISELEDKRYLNTILT